MGIIGTTTASTDHQSTMSEPALLRRVRTTRTMFAATDGSSNAVHNNSNTIMTDDDDYAIGGSVRAEHEYDHYSAPMPSHMRRHRCRIMIVFVFCSYTSSYRIVIVVRHNCIAIIVHSITATISCSKHRTSGSNTA